MVGQWLGDSYTEGETWVSEIGDIPAPLVAGLPLEATDNFNGHKSVDFAAADYFTVTGVNNPLGGATAMTIVAAWIPATAGATGDNFWNSSGIVTMEQGGSVADWALGWNGTRVNAGTGAPDHTIFSGDYALDQLQVVVFTWNNAGEQRLFVNGVNVAEDLSAGTAARNAADVSFGRIPTELGHAGLSGQIGEIQMYDTDESANVATITNALLAKYAEDPLLESAKAVSPTQFEFRIQSTAGFSVDPAGEFLLELYPLAGDPILPDPSEIIVTEDNGTVVVTLDAAMQASEDYLYYLDVPRIGGGPPAQFQGNILSHRLPFDLTGEPGTLGTWGIREWTIAGTQNIADAIKVVVGTTPTDNPPVSGTAPVFNHIDADTNGVTATGNFNNDLPILTDTPGTDDDFVVVGQTQVSVPAPGVYTFSVHSDDGFAMRISGTGGGRFIAKGGDGAIDPVDPQTLFRDGGTGDSNTRGTYEFDAAGTYDILYLGWDGGSGGFYELAWTEGTYSRDMLTNTWQLVGSPDDPGVPEFRERFITDIPGPSGTDGNFGVRTYLQASNDGTLVGNFGAAMTFLSSTARTPADVDGLTVDSQEPYLNHRDPEGGGPLGLVGGDLPFPANTTVAEDNVVTVAKGRINITSAGDYTFAYAGDDGFLLRLKGVDGLADPEFHMASGAGYFQMSNLNEFYNDGVGAFTGRGVVSLEVGSYDLEFVHQEGGGWFYYEVAAAAGIWLDDTTPPDGFQLVGYQAPGTVIIPGIAEPGWTVESSLPNAGTFDFTIAGAEARIDATLAMEPVPANAVSTWDYLDFRDPEDGPDGSFTPTNPWPLNTASADDNYAMRATGILEITQAGIYNLGFQGDDGGYLYIYGHNGTSDPDISSILTTNYPAIATIAPAPGSTANNGISVETGTGDSRTIVSVPLEVGQYELQTLVYEGNGGSWWEVIGGGDADRTFNFPLLTKNGAATVTTTSGISLVTQGGVVNPSPDFRISSFELTGNPVTDVSFNFASVSGESYTIEASTDLQTWVPVQTNVTASGGSTSVNVDLTGFTEFNGQTRVFFRVVLNE
ncbi:hypothetical protein Hsar01_02088 [Haloferula sargassicola]|uniref:PA14 domain-containing protein n=2 Tax=Haloferula sargassicola TaxID=490096 RepID=A0ABP9UMQ3_9BACT